VLAVIDEDNAEQEIMHGKGKGKGKADAKAKSKAKAKPKAAAKSASHVFTAARDCRGVQPRDDISNKHAKAFQHIPYISLQFTQAFHGIPTRSNTFQITPK